MSCTYQICERKGSVFSIEINSHSRCIGEEKFDLGFVNRKEMKRLLTIWISIILIQEVFTSTLVRLPRHTLTQPTSSVHTEYEATYQQKGKLGNGSFSTVSGKQEVVHDNCGDNWNAFADKCATLIKDLVASLANAVSSKPGDATNLQLRIKNTFKHIDNTDNCTCLNRTADSLASLFDNITIHTVQQNGNDGEVVAYETKKCDGSSCSDNHHQLNHHDKDHHNNDQHHHPNYHDKNHHDNDHHDKDHYHDNDKDHHDKDHHHRLNHIDKDDHDKDHHDTDHHDKNHHDKDHHDKDHHDQDHHDKDHHNNDHHHHPDHKDNEHHDKNHHDKGHHDKDHNDNHHHHHPNHHDNDNHDKNHHDKDHHDKDHHDKDHHDKDHHDNDNHDKNHHDKDHHDKDHHHHPDHHDKDHHDKDHHDKNHHPNHHNKDHHDKNHHDTDHHDKDHHDNDNHDKNHHDKDHHDKDHHDNDHHHHPDHHDKDHHNKDHHDKNHHDTDHHDNDHHDKDHHDNDHDDKNHHDKGHHDKNHHDKDHHDNDNHDKDHHDKDNHDKDHHDKDHHDKDHHDKDHHHPNHHDKDHHDKDHHDKDHHDKDHHDKDHHDKDHHDKDHHHPNHHDKDHHDKDHHDKDHHDNDNHDKDHHDKDNHDKDHHDKDHHDNDNHGKGHHDKDHHDKDHHDNDHHHHGPDHHDKDHDDKDHHDKYHHDKDHHHPNHHDKDHHDKDHHDKDHHDNDNHDKGHHDKDHHDKDHHDNDHHHHPNHHDKDHHDNDHHDNDHHDHKHDDQKHSKACEGDSCDENNYEKLSTVVPVVAQEQVSQPSLTLINSDGADPEFSDTSKELSHSNNRRGAKHPVVITEDSAHLSEHSGTAPEASEQSHSKMHPSNGATIVTTADTTKAPTELLTSKSDPHESTYIASPVNNDDTVKSDILIKPTELSSASQISSSEKPSTSTTNNDESTHSPVVIPVVSATKPVSGVVSESQISSSGKEELSTTDDQGSNQNSVVIPVASTVTQTSDTASQEKIPINSGSNYGSSKQTSDDTHTPVIVTVAETQNGSDNNNKHTEENSDGNNQASVTPVAITVQSVNSTAVEPQTTSSKDGDSADENKSELNKTPIVTSVVPTSEVVTGTVIEPQTTSNNQGDGTSGTNGGDSNHSTVVQPVVSAVNDHTSQPLSSSSNNDDAKSNPVAVVIPNASSVNSSDKISSGSHTGSGSKNNDEGNNFEKNQKETVKPTASLLLDPSVRNNGVNSATNPNSEVLEVPLVESTSGGDHSKDLVLPVKIEALAQTQAPKDNKSDGIPDDTSNTANNTPVIVIKGPKDKDSSQTDSLAVVPVVDSNSDHSELSKPTGHLKTTNSHPIYEPLPTTQTLIFPSKDSVNGRNSNQATVVGKNENVFVVTPVPAHSENDHPLLVKVENNPETKANEDCDNDNNKNNGHTTDSNVKLLKEGYDSIVVDSKHQENQPQIVTETETTIPVVVKSVEPISKTSQSESNLNENNDHHSDILLTTSLPVQLEPTSTEHGVESEQILKKHPLFSSIKNKKGEPIQQPRNDELFKNDGKLSGSNSPGTKWSSHTTPTPPVNYGSDSSHSLSGDTQSRSTVIPQVVEPVMLVTVIPEDSYMRKATTFQTTSTDPTPPQKLILTPHLGNTASVSAPQDSYETAPTSPQTLVSSQDDDDDEDCCSCESCTEEISNPKEYKEMACKDLEEARRELKAIFDKIKKKLKCGRKGLQKTSAAR